MVMVASPDNFYIGSGIVRSYEAAKEIKWWAQNTAYAIGDLVLTFDSSPTAGVMPIKLYECSNDGTSAGTGAGPDALTAGITDGTAAWDYVAPEDRGDVSNFVISGEVEELEKIGHRSGVGVVALSAEKKRSFSLAVTFEEVTLENLALLGFGTITGVAPNRYVKLGGGSRSNIFWEFEGKNDYGNRFQVVVPRCQLKPPQNMGFISEEFLSMETEGKITVMSDGNFYAVAEIA